MFSLHKKITPQGALNKRPGLTYRRYSVICGNALACGEKINLYNDPDS